MAKTPMTLREKAYMVFMAATTCGVVFFGYHIFAHAVVYKDRTTVVVPGVYSYKNSQELLYVPSSQCNEHDIAEWIPYVGNPNTDEQPIELACADMQKVM
jgi:hypothetical protein